MRMRNVLIGPICVFVIILLLIPSVKARNENMQKVAGITEPGPRKYEEPAVSANEDLLVVVYSYKGLGATATHEIRMALSFDGGFTFSAMHPKVSENDNSCRHPDVHVTKRYFGEYEYNAIYIVWQELTGYYWQINSKSYFIDYEHNLLVLDEQKYLSKIENGFLSSIYPRIEGNYLPYETDGIYQYDSATTVMAVWQQEYQEQGNFRIRCSYYDYQTHFSQFRSSHTNTLWTDSFDWPMQPLVESDSIEHPSIDVHTLRITVDDSYSYPEFKFAVSYEQRIDYSGSYSYNGCVHSAGGNLLYTINPNYPASNFQISSLRRYNLISAGWCYPDVAYYRDDTYYYLTVAFQDPDDNFAKVDANGYACSDPELNLGRCKIPSLRGISLDHIEPEYIFPASSNERSSWTNPGGITVIWRSDVTIPNTQDTYGIDSINLEYKNGTLRIIHRYNRGTDDADGDPNYPYIPIQVFHETVISADEYIDIKSVTGQYSHVSFKRNNEIWYFSLTNYH